MLRPSPEAPIASSSLRSADGVSIAIDDCGPHDAPAVVFVHGIAQSRRVWRSVLEGPLARELRMVAMDLRGHGDSETPEGDEAYRTGNRLGGDLRAVIEGLSLSRPVLVAWSYGGVVVGEYLRLHGSEDLGGLMFVAAAVKVGRAARELLGPAMLDNGRALISDDPGIYEAGARAFSSDCAASPIAPRVLEDSLAAMHRVRPHVRRALLTRSEDYSTELSRCRAPISTLHGSLDRVVLPAMSELIAALAPKAEGTVLEGVGHMPWLEAPEAFLASLRALIARRQT